MLKKPMVFIIIMAQLVLLNSAQGAERKLFNQEELQKVENYSSLEFVNSKKRDLMKVRSQHFFAYVLKQNRKSAKDHYEKDIKLGALKLLNIYSAPMDLKYLIKKELLKDIKKNE